nr:uncharacterized protein LOC111413805 [Onthophagus taurus]
MWRIIFLLGFLLIIKCENVYEQDIYWRDYKKIIPEDAVPVGYGLYVGQRLVNGVLIPGTLNPKAGKFTTEHNGKMEAIDDVKIMCSQEPFRFQWEYVNFYENDLPENLILRLVEAGPQNNTTNLPWYIGRAFHQNEMRIGKVDIFNVKSLLIWNNDGTFHRVYKFEILTDINKIVNNNIHADTSSDIQVIKNELSNKKNSFILSIAAELDLLSEEDKDLVKTSIWRLINEVKRAEHLMINSNPI